MGLLQLAEVLRREIAARVDVNQQRGPRRDGALGAAPRRFRAHLVGPQLAARDRQRLTLGAQAGEGAFVIADDTLPPECQGRGRAAWRARTRAGRWR